MREGVGRDGRALFPLMPFTEYRHLCESDARAVVAYLRTIPAVRHEVPRTRIAFPVRDGLRRHPRRACPPVASG